jgi:polyisoprenoid-binding protein YceI
MKKVLFILACAGLFAFKPNNGKMAPETFKLNPKKSTLQWVGKGVGKQHNGTVAYGSGTMVVDTKQIKSGFFYIDMKSIKCEDLKDEGFNKQLIDHLKSPDFFNVMKHNDATFKITKATRLDVPDGQQNYQIVGDLKIKNITKTIEFPATVTFAKKAITMVADVTIDRTKWQVNYNSGNIFKEVGDKMIEDNIDLKMNITMEL